MNFLNEKMDEIYSECCQQMLFFWKIEQNKKVKHQLFIMYIKNLDTQKNQNWFFSLF
jgi:hypothetical protein